MKENLWSGKIPLLHFKYFVNQYLILGRNRNYLGIGDDSIGELKVTKSQMYIEYPELQKTNDIQNSPYRFTIKLT